MSSSHLRRALLCFKYLVLSEDQLIHCFKEDQPCFAGLHRLKVMANTTDDEREDPFISINDSKTDMEAINKLDSDDETDEVIYV